MQGLYGEQSEQLERVGRVGRMVRRVIGSKVRMTKFRMSGVRLTKRWDVLAEGAVEVGGRASKKAMRKASTPCAAFVMPTLCALLFCCSAFGGGSLQSMIDRGGVVIVPAKTYMLTSPLQLCDNLTLLFEPGTRVIAAPGAFKAVEDCLIEAHGVKNVMVIARGATFVMQKSNYGTYFAPAPGYEPGEYRHALALFGVHNFSVYGGTFANSGGDGIYIGAFDTWRRQPCEDVIIKNAACDNNLRQGISITCAKRVMLDRCSLTETKGASPQAGLDIEPWWYNDPQAVLRGDPIQDITVRRCVAKHNRGPCYIVALEKTQSVDPPVRITFEDCKCEGVYDDQISLWLPIFSSDPTVAYMLTNLPVGSFVKWSGAVSWEKNK